VTRPWHLVTGEYPPDPGGVSDYTRAVAEGLAAAGETVHVWCPGTEGPASDPPGVQVHRSAGLWTGGDLRRLDVEVDQTPAPRRLLVQWVPHAFGRRSMNVAFCRWVRTRAHHGDIVDLMVHEPFLAFREGAFRHDLMAAVHRAMATMLLGVARRVWVSIPAWADRLRPWVLGRTPSFCWLPVPSTLAVTANVDLLAQVRSTVRGSHDLVIGHFGTYDANARRLLQTLAPQLMRALAGARLLLLGRGSDLTAADLRQGLPELHDRIFGVGALPADALSAHLQACDLMVQPYVDGASTRRTTLMAALAHGVPVVTTVGRLSEPFWISSPAVSAVDAGDLEGLIHATVALASDSHRRQRQSATARETYAARFDLAHVIRALREDRCESALPQALPGTAE
jgi:glycosyltransferase involved in cell wall biosynthesis